MCDDPEGELEKKAAKEAADVKAKKIISIFEFIWRNEFYF